MACRMALYHPRSESGHGLKIRSRGAPQLYPHLRKKLGAACTAAKEPILDLHCQ